MTAPTLSVCIVGSGPSGLYAADALVRKLKDRVRVDVLDRLPTPFGLVRAGVAPDHQGTKAITRQFDRILARPGVRFVGNVTVGRDVAVSDLRAAYDAVILAVGAPVDRPMGIPGEDLPGVHGSGAVVGWYNGHPDHAARAPRLDGPGVAVIGNGNVALDIARVLTKTRGEMVGGDLCARAADTIAGAPLTDLYIIGRRGPIEASFTPAELGELGALDRAAPVVNPADLPETVGPLIDETARPLKEKNLAILKDFAARTEAETTAAPVRVRFLFHAAPVAVLGDAAGVVALRLARTQTGAGQAGAGRAEAGRVIVTDQTFDVRVSTVISAIGYRCAPLDGVPLEPDRGSVANDGGAVGPGLFVVGWAKRGPSGVIPTNRADSMAVADRVVAWLDARTNGDQIGTGRDGPAALDALLAARGVRPVSLDDWHRIDAAEVARGAAAKCARVKITAVSEMLAVLDDPA